MRTQNQISEEKTIQELREAPSKNIKEEYQIKDKNILGKFKDFKKNSTVTLNYLDVFCDFIEKSKNLIQWEEQRMTKYFFLLAFVLFIFVTFLPLRTIIILFLTYKFNRGQNYHKRRVRNNWEVCKIELKNFLEDNKLDKLFEPTEEGEIKFFE